MRLSQTELVSVGLIIVYIAFATNPAPSHIKDFLSSPVGKIVGLLAVLYVTVYQSLIVGVFLGIAYIMTATSVTEYLDPKEQKPEEKKQASASGIPAPAVTGMLKELLKKGDVRLPQKAGKSETTPPPTTTKPKPLLSTKTTEHFASF